MCCLLGYFCVCLQSSFYNSIAQRERPVLSGIPRIPTSACSHATQTSTNFSNKYSHNTPKHLAKGSNLFPFASQPEYWCAYVCVRACVIRPCHHPILPAHQIVPIPESKVSWYPLSFPSILQSFPPQSPSNFHVLSNSSPCPPFQFSCSFHIHIISLMLILLLLPPGIPAPLPFPLECECELPGAGLTDPLGCMGVGARWPGFCC
jgi:hypothetical protein